MAERWTLDYINDCLAGNDSGMVCTKDDSGEVDRYDLRWHGDLDHNVPEDGVLVKSYYLEFLTFPHGEPSLIRQIAMESLGGTFMLEFTLRDLMKTDPKTARTRALMNAPLLLSFMREEVFFEQYGIEERGNAMRLKEDWERAA